MTKMKKKLLFVIPSLGAGGAEKSLVNLLNTIDATRFSVDLFMFSHEGLFISQLPHWINILPIDVDLQKFKQPLPNSIITFIKNGQIKMAAHRFLFYLKNRCIKNKGKAEQYSWQHLRSACSHLPDHYDSAIGFLEKASNYFVIDCVKAEKKIGFIHNDYKELDLDEEFDIPYFNKFSSIATVSEKCVSVLQNVFPQFANKIQFVPNIVSSNLIRSLADDHNQTMYSNSILSIGRLQSQKGFDLAIKAAAILKNGLVNFHWYIIGEGPERKNLEELIDKYNLSGYFTLMGLKANPYPYIKQSEIFAQTSRYEGKSLVVDEAKILEKPIVLTNFSTAKDQINHNENGVIVDMTPEAIAAGIEKYLSDANFTEKIIASLRMQNFGTEHEISKFYQLINE